MTDAPETIWAWKEQDDDPRRGWHFHWTSHPDGHPDLVEYIRADLATRQTQEAVARAERAEAELAALIHDLDRLKASETDALNGVQEAVAAERERCARVAWDYEDVYGARGMDNLAKVARQIAAAIREGEK